MKNFEVIIIGGSYAGLSAALSLGRSLRKVLVIDSGLPCNHPTPHSHNFLAHDGDSPAKLTQKARADVAAYESVTFVSGLAVAGTRLENGFEVVTAAGEVYRGLKLIFATGILDIFPDIVGFRECWGKSVIHCPYCHGFEYRGQKTAILANGDKAFHLSMLVRNLTPEPVVFTSGKPDFSMQQATQLQKNGIRIEEEKLVEIVHENGWIRRAILKSGRVLELDALYAALAFKQHSDLPVTLGCELTELGYVRVDSFHNTTVSGVYACGDSAGMVRSVANAVAGGSLAGAMVNSALVLEGFA